MPSVHTDGLGFGVLAYFEVTSLKKAKSRFPAIGVRCYHLSMWECLQSKCRFAFLPEYDCFVHMHEKQEGCERDQGFPQLAVWHHPATHAGRQPVGLGAETNGRAGG